MIKVTSHESNSPDKKEKKKLGGKKFHQEIHWYIKKHW